MAELFTTLEPEEPTISTVTPEEIDKLKLPNELISLYQHALVVDPYIKYYKDLSGEIFTVKPSINFKFYSPEKVLSYIEYSLTLYNPIFEQFLMHNPSFST